MSNHCLLTLKCSLVLIFISTEEKSRQNPQEKQAGNHDYDEQLAIGELSIEDSSGSPQKVIEIVIIL
jgi:hypothetical protein